MCTQASIWGLLHSGVNLTITGQSRAHDELRLEKSEENPLLHVHSKNWLLGFPLAIHLRRGAGKTYYSSMMMMENLDLRP